VIKNVKFSTFKVGCNVSKCLALTVHTVQYCSVERIFLSLQSPYHFIMSLYLTFSWHVIVK